MKIVAKQKDEEFRFIIALCLYLWAQTAFASMEWGSTPKYLSEEYCKTESGVMKIGNDSNGHAPYGVPLSLTRKCLQHVRFERETGKKHINQAPCRRE